MALRAAARVAGATARVGFKASKLAAKGAFRAGKLTARTTSRALRSNVAKGIGRDVRKAAGASGKALLRSRLGQQAKAGVKKLGMTAVGKATGTVGRTLAKTHTGQTIGS